MAVQQLDLGEDQFELISRAMDGLRVVRSTYPRGPALASRAEEIAEWLEHRAKNMPAISNFQDDRRNHLALAVAKAIRETYSRR